MNYFLVDINSAQQLDLSGSELLVYSALVYLTKHSAWKGSTYQLAKLSRCGDADTAGRVVKKLIARGLIVRTTLGISLPQNAASLPQNAAVIPQNAANQKKVTKKNIINNSQSLSVSKETDRTDGQTDFDICLNCKFIILLTTKNGAKRHPKAFSSIKICKTLIPYIIFAS